MHEKEGSAPHEVAEQPSILVAWKTPFQLAGDTCDNRTPESRLPSSSFIRSFVPQLLEPEGEFSEKSFSSCEAEEFPRCSQTLQSATQQTGQQNGVRERAHKVR